MATAGCQLFNAFPTIGCVDGYYHVNNKYFELQCLTGTWGGGSMTSYLRSSLQECMSTCDGFAPCGGVQWDGIQQCYLYTRVVAGGSYGSGPYGSARDLLSNPCAVSTTTSTTTSESTTTSSTTTSSTTAESTTSSSPTPKASPSCPVYDSFPATGCVDGYYHIQDLYYDVRCSATLGGNYWSSDSAASLEDCVNHCSNYPGCVAAEYQSPRSCKVYKGTQQYVGAGPNDGVLLLPSNPCPVATTTSSATSSTTSESTTSETTTTETTTTGTTTAATTTTETTTTEITTTETTTTETTTTETTTADTTTTETTTCETSTTSSEVYTTESWTTAETSTTKKPRTTTNTWTTPASDCTSWTEEEKYEDEDGGKYTKTHTIYPTGCKTEDDEQSNTKWDHWESTTTTKWEAWPTTTHKQKWSTESWNTWSKPGPSSDPEWDDWYTTVTVITTSYINVCPTGYVTVPYHKTITWSHPQATTTDYVWPVDKDGCPSGFTTTTSVCAYGCGKPWSTVTVTIPIKDDSDKEVDYWGWLTKTADATSGWSKTTTATEVKATNSESWKSWSAEPSSKVKVWTGAASNVAVGSVFIVVCGLIAGLVVL